MASIITGLASMVLLALIWKMKRANGEPMFTKGFKWFSSVLAVLLIFCGVYLNQVVAIVGFGFLAYKVVNGVLTAVAAWPYIKKCRKYVLNHHRE